jgi:hypothetical protein
LHPNGHILTRYGYAALELNNSQAFVRLREARQGRGMERMASIVEDKGRMGSARIRIHTRGSMGSSPHSFPISCLAPVLIKSVRSPHRSVHRKQKKKKVSSGGVGGQLSASLADRRIEERSHPAAARRRMDVNRDAFG